MGKLNVAILRYLNKEDFRVLTAVSGHLNSKFDFFQTHMFFLLFRSKC